jgi:hypothetical protein
MVGKTKGFRAFVEHESELTEELAHAADKPAKKPAARAESAAGKSIRDTVGIAATPAPISPTAAQRSVDAAMKEFANQAASATRHAAGAAEENIAAGAAAGNDVLAQGGAAMRQASQTATQAAHQGAETLRQGTEAVTRSAWQVAEGVGRHAAQAGRAAVEAAGVYQEASETVTRDLRVFAELPKVALDGIRELSEAMSQVANRTAKANSEATQNLFRCRSFHEVAEIQAGLLKQQVETMLEGGAEVLRITTRLSQSALRPIAQRQAAE